MLQNDAHVPPYVLVLCQDEGVGGDGEQVVVRCYMVAAVNAEDGGIVCLLHDLEEVYEHLVGMRPWKQDVAVVFVDSA
jgi:hypothetical protein